MNVPIETINSLIGYRSDQRAVLMRYCAIVRRILIIGFLLFAASFPLLGQTCCSGGVPVSNNIGFQSSTAGTVQLSINGDFNFLRTLKEGSQRLDDDLRLRTTQSYILRGAYAIRNRLTIETFLPLVRQTRRVENNFGSIDRQATFGIGDPVFLGIYDLIQKELKVRIGGGPQIPLGSFSERDDRGLFLLEDLQPGSGAWDIILFSSVEYNLKNRPSALLYLNTIYSLTGTNDNARNGAQAYRFGNDIQFIGGISDQLLLFDQVVSPGLSIRYRHAERDQIDKNESPGTGGDFVFARISSSIPFTKWNSSFNFNLEFPIWTRVNETQLSPSLVFNFGWSRVFESKKEYDALIDL